MANAGTLTNRTIAQRFREVKDEEALWGEISWETQQLVKRIVETTAAEEMAACLGAGRYERSPYRRGWRNGYADRSLLTRWGFIDFHLPRARNADLASPLLARFRRREQQVDELIRGAFLRGVRSFCQMLWKFPSSRFDLGRDVGRLRRRPLPSEPVSNPVLEGAALEDQRHEVLPAV